MVKREVDVVSRQAALAAKGINVSVESVLAEIEIRIEKDWQPKQSITFSTDEGYTYLNKDDRLYVARLLESSGWTCDTHTNVIQTNGDDIITHYLRIW